MKKVRECDTSFLRKTLGSCRRPPFGQTLRTNSVLTTYFAYNITTIYIQQIFAITIPETRIVLIQSHHSGDSYSRHRNTHGINNKNKVKMCQSNKNK